MLFKQSNPQYMNKLCTIVIQAEQSTIACNPQTWINCVLLLFKQSNTWINCVLLLFKQSNPQYMNKLCTIVIQAEQSTILE